jgi:hypothetical protein
MSPKSGLRISGADGRRRRVAEDVEAWLERVVIGLGLCPFAEQPFASGRVRLVISSARDNGGLLREIHAALADLHQAAPGDVETTLIAVPGLLGAFDDFLDFLDTADAMLDESGWRGLFQLASFHPDYRFADAPDDDRANYTNRAPCPLLHLLREASVTRAVEAVDDPAAIPKRNARLLREMSDAEFRRLFAPPQ